MKITTSTVTKHLIAGAMRAEGLGDEYWYRLPRVKNPQYEYLCGIILAVKAAFKQLTEEKQS